MSRRGHRYRLPPVRLNCILREVYNRKGEKVSKEITIQITSAGAEKMNASDMNRHTREHWGIENKSHYVRDTLYREDHNQSWEGNGPQALASLHNVAAGLFRMKGVKSIKETTELIHMDGMLALNYMTTVSDGRCAVLSLNGPARHGPGKAAEAGDRASRPGGPPCVGWEVRPDTLSPGIFTPSVRLGELPV